MISASGRGSIGRRMKKNGGGTPLYFERRNYLESIPFLKKKVKWNVVGEKCVNLKGGPSCIHVVYMSADMWHALMWLRRFVALWKGSFSWVVNWPHWLFVVGSALSHRMTHTQRKVIYFFLSLCQHAHHVRKINGIFKITTSGDSFPILIPPQKVLVARQWKLPTWLIFTRRQSRNPEPWYARSPFSLYHYHVSISYYIPPNPLWDFIAGGVGGGGGRKRS